MVQVGDEAAKRPAVVVRAFYEAINRGDGEALDILIVETFSDEASIELPGSLPYGGRVEGKPRLRRMFTAMTSGQVSVGPRQITVEQIVADDTHAVAVLSFDWYPLGSDQPVASGASELWTFEGDTVSAIRAYYWDTAALANAGK